MEAEKMINVGLMDYMIWQQQQYEAKHSQSIEIARNALAMGLSAAQTAQLTGLSADEVAQLSHKPTA